MHNEMIFSLEELISRFESLEHYKLELEFKDKLLNFKTKF